MNSEEPNTPREELEIKITALLLGELDAAEADQIRQAIAADPELTRLHAQLGQALELVKAASTDSSSPFNSSDVFEPLRLPRNKRDALLAGLKTITPGQHRKPKQTTPGFRLLELAAVVALVALLAAMLLPSLSKSKQKAHSVALQNNLRQIELAKHLWAEDQGKAAADVPTREDLEPYLNEWPKSLQGEEYVPGSLLQPVVAEVDSGVAPVPFRGMAEITLADGRKVHRLSDPSFDNSNQFVSEPSPPPPPDIPTFEPVPLLAANPKRRTQTDYRSERSDYNIALPKVEPGSAEHYAGISGQPGGAGGVDSFGAGPGTTTRFNWAGGSYRSAETERASELDAVDYYAWGVNAEDAVGRVAEEPGGGAHDYTASPAPAAQPTRASTEEDLRWARGRQLHEEAEISAGAFVYDSIALPKLAENQTANGLRPELKRDQATDWYFHQGTDSKPAAKGLRVRGMTAGDAAPTLGEQVIASRLFRSKPRPESDASVAGVPIQQAEQHVLYSDTTTDEMTRYAGATTFDNNLQTKPKEELVGRRSGTARIQQTRDSLATVQHINPVPAQRGYRRDDVALDGALGGTDRGQLSLGYGAARQTHEPVGTHAVDGYSTLRRGTEVEDLNRDPFQKSVGDDTEAIILAKRLPHPQAGPSSPGFARAGKPSGAAGIVGENESEPLVELEADSDGPQGSFQIVSETPDTIVEGLAINDEMGVSDTVSLGREYQHKAAYTKRETKAQPDPALPREPAADAPIPQPEVQAATSPFSTFSLNVSDVSFKLAAASLEQGQMPDMASVRCEEFINAFDYRDPVPTAGQPLAFTWERSHYPFAHNRDLLRFSVQTAAKGREAGRPLNLVLLLDNSGSMERSDRVGIVQECLNVLSAQLTLQDTVSVVAFARTARLWVDGVPGLQAAASLNAAGKLTPEGGTNLEEAMNLAYATAERHYIENGVNRVVMLTDGAANLGNVDPQSLKSQVESQRRRGIALDCFGIGWEGYNDDLLEVLSRNGDGRYGFVNSPGEAASEFASQLAGALQVAASDVKVQVEFNPQRVTAYRQLGYAKHQLTKEQFRDNTVDAAEIGAAEAGNALYVIETDPQGTGPVATVRARFKVPATGEYREYEWLVPYTGEAVALEDASAAMRLAGSASAFSEWLVASPYAGDVHTDHLLKILGGVPEVFGADSRPRQLEQMIHQARRITGD